MILDPEHPGIEPAQEIIPAAGPLVVIKVKVVIPVRTALCRGGMGAKRHMDIALGCLIGLGLPWMLMLFVGTGQLWFSTVILLSTVVLLFVLLTTGRILSRKEGMGAPRLTRVKCGICKPEACVGRCDAGPTVEYSRAT